MIKTLFLDKSTILLAIKKINLTFSRNDITKYIDEQYWQYSGMGEIGGYFTYANERNNYYSSIYIVVKRFVKFQQKTISAAQSLDTLTDFDSRGKGFFIKCADRSYEFIKSNGVEFIFGFPNKNSFGGFTSKLGWKSLDPVPFLVLPLNITYFIRKLLTFGFMDLPNFYYVKKFKVDSKVIISEVNYFTSEYDSLWKKFSENIAISVVRNAEYLNWRFIDNPQEKYLIYCAMYDGYLAGFIVINIKIKHGGKIGYVMELIFDPSYPFIASSLLSYAVNKFRSESVDVVLSWCFDHSIPYPYFKKAGFYKLPNFLRQIELHFGYKIIKYDEILSEHLSNPRSWYLSYSDSDTN